MDSVYTCSKHDYTGIMTPCPTCIMERREQAVNLRFIYTVGEFTTRMKHCENGSDKKQKNISAQDRAFFAGKAKAYEEAIEFINKMERL